MVGKSGKKRYGDKPQAQATADNIQVTEVTRSSSTPTREKPGDRDHPIEFNRETIF